MKLVRSQPTGNMLRETGANQQEPIYVANGLRERRDIYRKLELHESEAIRQVWRKYAQKSGVLAALCRNGANFPAVRYLKQNPQIRLIKQMPLTLFNQYLTKINFRII